MQGQLSRVRGELEQQSQQSARLESSCRALERSLGQSSKRLQVSLLLLFLLLFFMVVIRSVVCERRFMCLHVAPRRLYRRGCGLRPRVGTRVLRGGVSYQQAVSVIRRYKPL